MTKWRVRHTDDDNDSEHVKIFKTMKEAVKEIGYMTGYHVEKIEEVQ